MMKKLYTLLILLCIVLPTFSQTDYNEPPSRSEFEQVKSKIQLYEQRQKNVLGELRGMTDKMKESQKCLDSIMLCKQNYIDSMLTEIVMESHGIHESSSSMFLKTDDLTPLNDEIKSINEKMETNMGMARKKIMGIIGGILMLIIIVVVILMSQIKTLKGKLNNKLTESNKKLHGELTTLSNNLNSKILLEISTMQKDMKNKIESIRREQQSTTEESNKAMQAELTKTSDYLTKQLENFNTDFSAKIEAITDKMDKSKNTINKNIRALKKKIEEKEEQSEE